MIIIHKTFSKKEIIKFMADCGIYIEEDFNKEELKIYLNNLFQKNIKIKNNKYNYYKKIDLLLHLKNKNYEKELKPIEKKRVINIARKVIHLAKHHYMFNFSEYNNFEEVKYDCLQIYKYGYLSSVRKAIKYYNYLDLDHINFINSNNIYNKKEIKFNFKKGNYIVKLN